MASKKTPLKERIARFLINAPREKQTYFRAMIAAFPEKDYPNAWRYSSNGGPPGCAMRLDFNLIHIKKFLPGDPE